MKRTLTAALVAGLPVVAQAADLPNWTPPIASPRVSFNWTGVYLGAQGGWSWAHFLRDVGADPTSDWNSNGGIAGGFLGYQRQSGNLVYGIEGDFEWWGISGDDGGQADVVDDPKGKWLASVRGRLGWAHGKWLIYGTGGYQWGNTDVLLTDLIGGGTATFNLGVHGWTAGGGLEWALAHHVIAGVEYRYSDFNKVAVGALPFANAGHYNIDAVHAVRGRLSVKY